MKRKDIEAIMNGRLGFEGVKEENIVEVPSDDCEGHMGSGSWKVWAARCGEFTVLVYEYQSGQYAVMVV